MAEALLVAFGAVVEGVTVNLARGFVERWHRHRGRRVLDPKRLPHLLKGLDDQVAGAIGRELDGVHDDEWAAAVTAAHDSLEAVGRVTVDDGLAVELRPEILEQWVRARSAGIRRAAALSADGTAVYDRVLSVACHQVVAALMALPEFATELGVATFREVRDLQRTVDGLDVQRRQAELAGVRFEDEYCRQVEHVLGRMELFGLDRERRRPLDSAYVNLAVARWSDRRHAADDDELTGAGLDVANALRDHRRVVLRAGAGAGKTTVLRWLAASAARGTLWARAAGGGPVPFYVSLRNFAQGEFPAPEALPMTVARVVAAGMPPTWVHDQFRTGRALLLVDGVDELEQDRRRQAREWLLGLVSAFGDARFVVSSRPFAIGTDWLAEHDFVTFDLLPLSTKGIGTFIARWHAAARQEYAIDQDKLARLARCERELTEQLAVRAELRKMAGTPLLCGLLCALYENDLHLPRDRKGLYDSALDLLLTRWDDERKLVMPWWPPLGKEAQLTLLQRFAYWMVRNDKVVVSRDEAVERFAHAMRGVRPAEADAERVLQRMLERTGLLREPDPGDVQFVHRTFRDYLAGKEVVECGDYEKVLIAHAHLDHWYDVVINAVVHARPKERDHILRGLLAGNVATLGDPRATSRLHLVAAVCSEQAEVLGTDEVRRQVQRAASRLIPPATFDDAELLARAGPFVLDLLPGPAGLSARQAACVVRTIALIGRDDVRERLAEFVKVGGLDVVDELLRAWRLADDPEDYARKVLGDVDFGDRPVPLRGWHRIRLVPHLTRLRNLKCLGDFAPLDPVAGMPSLRRLELVYNDALHDLAPLARCRTLRSLLILGCAGLKDLAPLGDTNVEELELYRVAADLGTLRAGKLRHLVIRDERLAGGLHPLPATLPLVTLEVGNLPDRRCLLGVERWRDLERVSVNGVPGADELAALAELPQLRRLDIQQGAASTPATPESLTLALPQVEIWIDGARLSGP